jgi:hypothetical protein
MAIGRVHSKILGMTRKDHINYLRSQLIKAKNMAKTILIIMIRGCQYFCHDEMDQKDIGFTFHKF